MPSPRIPRRRFIQVSACAALAGGLGGCASLAAVRVGASDGRARLVLADHPQLSTPGGWLRVQPDTLPHPLIVLAEGGDAFTVLSPVCTHRQCIVDVAGARLVCPCHGSEYDRAGEVLVGPAEVALARYPATVTTGGELVIELDERS
ncbi:MAG: Rieske (2Fe-2S) protein [Gemmatimonadota bacterium]|nr:Rieske (2Fe-2S) protein [Gemmatimonadota bacterium]